MATEKLYADSHSVSDAAKVITTGTANSYGAQDGTEASTNYLIFVPTSDPWASWGFDNTTRSTYGGIINSIVPKLRWKVDDFDFPRYHDVLDVGIWVNSESTYYTLATYGSGSTPPSTYSTTTLATVSDTYISNIDDMNNIKMRLMIDTPSPEIMEQALMVDAWTLELDYFSEERRDVVLMVLDQLRNNIRASLASTTIVTTWYNQGSARPQITVGPGPEAPSPFTMGDGVRKYLSTVHVDTWIGSRAFGGGMKRARYLLDDEVHNIINTNRKDPESPYRWMHVTGSLPLDEISDERRVFRTRHAVQVEWYEDL